MKELNIFGNGESNSIEKLQISHAKLMAILTAEKDNQTKQVRIKQYAVDMAQDWCDVNNETVSAFVTRAVIKEVLAKIEEEISNKKQLYAMAPRPRILEAAQEVAVYNKGDKALD
jgi:hypothetical protein